MKGFTITKNDIKYRIRKDGKPDRRFRSSDRLVKRLNTKPVRLSKKRVRKVKYVLPKWYKFLVLVGILSTAYIVYWIITTFNLLNVEKNVISVRSGEYQGTKNAHCVGEYNKLFCNAKYEWDTKRMIATAICESGMNPEAWNVNNNGSVDRGLLQVNSVHGFKPSDLFNPEKNVRAGYKVWLRQGEGAWYAQGTECFVKELAKL